MLRPVFEDGENESIWIEGTSQFEDSHALITISNENGERSVVVTPREVKTVDAKDFVEAPKERVVRKKTRKPQLVRKIVTFGGYGLTATLILFITLSMTGVIQARVVLTGSMAPQINSGDIVILKPQNGIEPKIGDVVTYTGRRFDGSAVSTFTHRVIGGNSIQGYLLKGDANPSPDVQKVKISDIAGTVFFVIPLLGKILIPKNLVTVIPLIFVLWLMVDRWRNE